MPTRTRDRGGEKTCFENCTAAGRQPILAASVTLPNPDPGGGCPDGEVCADGQCQTIPADPNLEDCSTTGCPDGQTCENGVCVDREPECRYRNDGWCDDGRPGSATDVCAYGTDPEDCDPVEALDPCPYRNDGECDDGRAGAATYLCATGTDPEDCDPTPPPVDPIVTQPRNSGLRYPSGLARPPAGCPTSSVAPYTPGVIWWHQQPGNRAPYLAPGTSGRFWRMTLHRRKPPSRMGTPDTTWHS